MSGTISTSVMVAELSRRVPIGFTANVAIDSLNGVLRWINQQGSFPWMQRKTTVAFVTAGDGAFNLPPDFDPGKEAVLYGLDSDVVPTEIPYMTWSDAVKNQAHFTGGGQNGILSCWSYYATAVTALVPPYGTTVTFKGQAFPGSQVKVQTLPFVYHAITFPALASNAQIFFPTPDHFDYLIVELAEAEIMRQYRLAGWEILYKRTTDQLRAMLQAYTSTKVSMAPTPEIINAAQTKQAQRAS